MELREHILWAVREEGKDEGREEGIMKGREEGREDGIEQKAMQTARLMLANNEPTDKVMLYTGLSKADLDKLAH